MAVARVEEGRTGGRKAEAVLMVACSEWAMAVAAHRALDLVAKTAVARRVEVSQEDAMVEAVQMVACSV